MFGLASLWSAWWTGKVRDQSVEAAPWRRTASTTAWRWASLCNRTGTTAISPARCPSTCVACSSFSCSLSLQPGVSWPLWTRSWLCWSGSWSFWRRSSTLRSTLFSIPSELRFSRAPESCSSPKQRCTVPRVQTFTTRKVLDYSRLWRTLYVSFEIRTCIICTG